MSAANFPAPARDRAPDRLLKQLGQLTQFYRYMLVFYAGMLCGTLIFVACYFWTGGK
jgi:hypothetical protein